MRKTQIAQDINPELLKQSDYEEYDDSDESKLTQSSGESEQETSNNNLFKNILKI